MQVTKQKSLFDIVSTRAVITSDMFVYSSLSTRGEVNDTCRLFFIVHMYQESPRQKWVVSNAFTASVI